MMFRLYSSFVGRFVSSKRTAMMSGPLHLDASGLLSNVSEDQVRDQVV